MSNRYPPREDTLLLADATKEIEAKKVLEIGVGSGMVTLTLAKSNDYVVGTEIDLSTTKAALDYIREQGYGYKVDLLICDGASAIRSGIFDIVLFNPPYLQTDIGVDQTTNGGEDGTELSERWFEDAESVMKHNGQIIFVASSLSKHKRLLQTVASKGLYLKKVRSQHFLFEDIIVFEASRML